MVGTGQTDGVPAFSGSAGTVIELGVARDTPDDEPSQPLTWRRLRPVALTLAVALLLTAGGSGPPPAPDLVQIAVVQRTVTVATSYNLFQRIQLTDDRLVTSTLEADGATWLLSAYEWEGGRPDWTYRFPITRETQPDVQYRAGLLLLTGARTDGTPGMRTVALDATTGRERWSLPHRVLALHGDRYGLGVDEVFPADAALSAQPQNPESVYTSSWGQNFSRPPLGELATGVELDTGKVLWRSELLRAVRPDLNSLPGGPSAPGAAREPVLAVVTGDGAVELWDQTTGAVRHRFPAVSFPSDYGVQLGGRLLLVQHKVAEMTAYSTEDYQPRWTIPTDEQQGFPWFCGPSELICADAPTGTAIVDAATGSRTWRVMSGHGLAAVGGHLIELAPGAGASYRPLRTIDRRTGEPLIPLLRWRAVSPTWGAPSLLLATSDLFVGPTWLGLLSPGAAAPVRLGLVPVGIDDCQLNAAVIACVTAPNEVRIWRYRGGTPADDR
ncbi:putative pyrroloquinoline-quinone binding quinoprotein [Micromonospora pisi]|uniref:Putative pyrroloquinoline-quinone binding quinoprotein n=1 Tax=Micromonospora pisi TaxID=589240 RepID=A0A495JNN0_9ACTN|nr:PQQ-binding-like beta-propeller repeat protein [Micromonospora pisi]RKR90670.1 putative pyrroloquinoline-quinone binding quinoprotein [Micromonospora pisi]